MTDPTRRPPSMLKPYAKLGGKPVLASWMGGTDVAAGEEILNAAGIPTFPYPDTAARCSITCGATARTCAACMKRPSCRQRSRQRDHAAVAASDRRKSRRERAARF